jgi:hypothetical protein
MRRTRATVLGAVLLGLMMLPMEATVLAGTRPNNCEAKLVGKTFYCTFVGQHHAEIGRETWQFTANGLGDFQLMGTATGPLGCSCQADGDLDDPDFDRDGNEFLCVAETGAFALVGKVRKSGSIRAERTTAAPGTSSLSECRKS